MLVLLTLSGLAIALPLLLALLHGRGSAPVWILFAIIVLAILAGVTTLGSSLAAAQQVGILLLYLIPSLFVFLLALLVERRALIAVVGPLVFASGFFVALSLAVTLGLLQP